MNTSLVTHSTAGQGTLGGPSAITIRIASTNTDLCAVARLRVAVFVQEQGIPLSAEFDTVDLTAEHFLALHGPLPVGTARIVFEGPRARIGRLAVVASHRGTGVGSAIVRALIRHGYTRGIRHFRLHAQMRALAFYTRLGFSVTSSVFFEEGIPHCRMELRL